MSEHPHSGSDLPTDPYPPIGGSRRAMDMASSLMAGAGGLGLRVGDRVGPFTILGVLGEGGFGMVYLAERREPMVQKVALKIIKPGMDSAAVVARFEQERQALAILDHPGIAKVFDAGTTPPPSMLPYFAMEYVAGRPITDFCDQQMLDTRGRLELFVHVCEAVEHAHRRGIIHRDLKPSNVLVSVSAGATPQPKIIDFGIAKAVSHTLSAKAVFTEQGQFIGTPEYMSPEQADNRAMDVDTRTDVYSLGVLLYELLVGALPFDPATLRSAGLGEILRIIRDVDPPRPSTRLSQIGGAADELARKRRTDPEVLRRLLHRELEWIPLMAMRKDREQRYRSPAELADDVRNYLNGLPLLAGPESAMYMAEKFVRRHRGAVAAAGIAILGGVGGLAGLAVGYVKASNAAISERDAKDAALAAKSRSDAVTKFVINAIGETDPEKTKGTDPTIKDMLDKASAGITQEMSKDPEAEAALRSTLGQAYVKLGRYKEAYRELSRARDIDRLTLGVDHLTTLADEYYIGVCLIELRDLPNARVAFQRAYDGRKNALGALAAETLDTLSQLGFVTQLDEDFKGALKIYRLVLDAQEQTLPEGASALAAMDTRSSLADVLQVLGEFKEAETEARKLHDLALKAQGPLGLMTLRAGSQLASILKDLSQFDESERLAREVLEGKSKLLGPDHTDTVLSESTLAQTLFERRKFAEAENFSAHTVAVASKTLGEDNDVTLSYKAQLARIRQQIPGKLEDAERLMRETLESRKRRSGPDATQTLAVMNNLGLILLDAKKYGEAEIIFREMLAGVDRVMGNEHWIRGQARVNVGECLFELERYADAEPMMLEGYEWLKRTLPEGNARTSGAAVSLVKLYEKWGKPEKAAEWKKISEPPRETR